MAEEVGIVLKLYDQVSPSLKTIAGNTKAFDKNMDDLEESVKAYDKAQTTLTQHLAGLKKEMAENNVKMKEAQQAYRNLKGVEEEEKEARKQALDAAIDEQVRLRRELDETQAVIKANASAYKELYQQAGAASAAESRLNNRAEEGVLSRLGKAGLGSLVGEAVSQGSSVLIQSALGQPEATMVGSVLSGVASGAAMGSVLGLPGAAVGGVIGGIAGAATGGSQIFQEKDQAFQSYVQEAAQEQMEEMSTSIASGSDTAAQRELDKIAFEKQLGEEAGEEYLVDLRSMAASTPMTYSDLTAMSRSLAPGFGDDTDRMLELLTGIGNAGSAVGVDSSGMAYLAQVLSRVQSSGKFSREDLDAFQDRGIDVLSALAGSLGVSQGEVYELISKGSISGGQAVDIIQQGLEQYAGAMDQMAKTFSGLESTLEDAQTEMDNAYGEGYNEARKQGYQEEIDWLSGESGVMLQEANRAMGAWQAQLENSKEQYIRDAVDAVLDSKEYQETMASGTEEGYAQAGRMLMEAKVRGMNEYNASDGAQLLLEYETALAEQIRDDTASNDAYWDAGYRKGQAYTKGLMSARLKSGNLLPQGVEGSDPGLDGQYFLGAFAYGLAQVPRDGYYYLHQDERVLTAQEAREAERQPASAIQRAEEPEPGLAVQASLVPGGYARGLARMSQESQSPLRWSGQAQAAPAGGEKPAGGTSLHVTITGNSFGADMTPEAVAQAMVSELELLLAGGLVS